MGTPILLLTARDAISDKICGYDSGADDYMTKPFSPAELLAHLRALTRRQGDVVFETLTVGDLTLNLESMDLTCGDESIRLSQKEFAIARILLGSPGAVLSKEQLISRAWGPSSSASDNNVEAYISFLRKKMARGVEGEDRDYSLGELPAYCGRLGDHAPPFEAPFRRPVALL